jgi:hypothetical protein
MVQGGGRFAQGCSLSYRPAGLRSGLLRDDLLLIRD